jgi:NAD-dependent DNA ligase
LTLGDKIIDLFIEQRFLTDFVSIYHLVDFSHSILQVEGFKDKKLENIIESIEKSRNMPLANFFVALGMPQVGRKTGKLLAQYVAEKIINNVKIQKNDEENEHTGPVSIFSDFNNSKKLENSEESHGAKELNSCLILQDILFHLTYNELEDIHDIGPATARSIIYYLEENHDMITKLLLEINPILPIVENTQGAVQESTFT